jgi:hypothetical protein
MLLFAERKAFGSRVTVIDAIADRNRVLEEERQADEGDVGHALTPADVAPASPEH